MTFQTRVNNALPVAVEGDFASTNPRASVITVPGGLTVAASQTVRVGYFAWAGLDGQVYSSQAAADATGASQLGFVGRQANAPNAVITTFLSESTMVLNAGMPCTLFNKGDFWASFGSGAAFADAIYADATNGQPTNTSNTGANPATGFTAVTAAKANVVTAATSTIAATTGVLTVATVASGGNNIQAGDRVTGTGVPANTMITAQLSGTTGGAGTYQTTSLNRGAVAAAAFTFHQGQLAKITSSYVTGG